MKIKLYEKYLQLQIEQLVLREIHKLSTENGKGLVWKSFTLFFYWSHSDSVNFGFVVSLIKYFSVSKYSMQKSMLNYFIRIFSFLKKGIIWDGSTLVSSIHIKAFYWRDGLFLLRQNISYFGLRLKLYFLQILLRSKLNLEDFFLSLKKLQCPLIYNLFS